MIRDLEEDSQKRGLQITPRTDSTAMSTLLDWDSEHILCGANPARSICVGARSSAWEDSAHEPETAVGHFRRPHSLAATWSPWSCPTSPRSHTWGGRTLVHILTASISPASKTYIHSVVTISSPDHWTGSSVT